MKTPSALTSSNTTLGLILALFFLSGCTAINPIPAENPLAVSEKFSHESFERVLQGYVDDMGRVDYATLKEQPEDLELYYDLITRYSPDSHPELFPSRDDELAYWINAYNAAVIKTVVTYYPIDSVLDVKNPAPLFFLTDKAGFFFFQRLTFGGATTSLYYLENSVIRDRYKDPRIHFIINCASIGCPQLPRTALTGEGLSEQLDFETRKFVSEERNFFIDHDQQTIFLSSIFKWYESDYLDSYKERYPDSEPALTDYIRLYLSREQQLALDEVKDRYVVAFNTYDWGLNRQ